jgi:hypothetical protein
MPAFLGVLVAMFLSNIKETKSEKEFIEKCIKEIYMENSANLASLENNLSNLNNDIDTIIQYLNDTTIAIDTLVLGKMGGLGVPEGIQKIRK